MKKVLLIPAVLISLWLVFVLLLTGANAIPKSAVSKNIEKSARYYDNQYMFRQMTKDENSTIVHNYADIVWLNIIYCSDNETPFESAVKADFYEGTELYKSQSLTEVINKGYKPNKSYSRYWHGATVFIKPMLVLFDIHGIRLVNIVLCLLCVAVLSFICIRKKLYAPFLGYVLSHLLCFTYIIPLCMEYMPVFVLMHLFTVFVILKGYKLNGIDFAAMFAGFGAITCYLDFLTNEILTLFVPLAFALWLSGEAKRFKALFVASVSWFVGYALTWGVKWLLCLLVAGSESFMLAVTDGAYRMAGAVPDMQYNQVLSAVLMNINRIFPFNFLKSNSAVLFFAIVFVAVVFCWWYMFRKNNGELSLSCCLFVIALMPYARYAVLSNHSCLHPFFTFRTQMITVMAITMALAACTDKKRLPFLKKRRR